MKGCFLVSAFACAKGESERASERARAREAASHALRVEGVEFRV